jgi:hypothetical protein
MELITQFLGYVKTLFNLHSFCTTDLSWKIIMNGGNIRILEF